MWKMCWGCGECGKVWIGMGSRCVEVCLRSGKMCLGCGERCGKGVGVGAKDVGKYGEVWGTGNRCVGKCV